MLVTLTRKIYLISSSNTSEEDSVVDDRDQEEVKILKWNLI